MCVFVSAVFGFTLAVFVYKGALTVESGCSLVDHTLLGVGVFDGGVIVGYEVRLREKRERTKGGETVKYVQDRYDNSDVKHKL